MWKTYLKIALRSLRKQKLYSFINVAGLAVGLAACLLILLYVLDELSYDRFHEKADRIVRVEMDVPSTNGLRRWATTLVPLGEAMRERLPAVERVVRVGEAEKPLITRGETQFYEDRFFYTEPSFFDVFDYELLRGDASELARPHTIVLSEPMAAKYFPDTDPLGQLLTASGKWSDGEQTFEVVGVMAEAPHNAHFRPAFLASHATSLAGDEDRLWMRIAYTYVLLREGHAVQDLEDRLPRFEQDVLHPNFRGQGHLALMPLTRIHLHGQARSDIAPQGDIRYVYLFSAVALLILLMACINYMNLSTARSARRATEVGVRKVVGARRRQLVAQFLSESVLFTVLALTLAVGLVELLLPVFGQWMGRPLQLGLSNARVVAALGVVSLAVGLAAGSYPAFLLASFRPAHVLKGTVRVKQWPALRKGLVVFQFAVSIALIVCTIVIQRQLHYVQDTRLGFEEEQVLVVHTRDALGEDAAVFKQQVARHSAVRRVALASGIPSEPTGNTSFKAADVEDFEAEEGHTSRFDVFWVDADFVPTLQIELAAGRNFSATHPTDRNESILINETAARSLGWQEPLGKTIRFSAGPKRVVGVVRDFHIEDMRQEIGPMLLHFEPRASTYAVVKLGTTDLRASVASLSETWEQFVPKQPFEYSFLDDDFAAMYRSEQRLGRLLGGFSLLAIFVACLGLFGLAAFMTEQRTKEIGIRKVLGASVSVLVVLLSKDFLRLVAVAFVLAAPVAYVAMQYWLGDFAYRVTMGMGTFAGAGLLALAVALLTVCYHAVRAALADPVESLRYE